MTKTAPRHRLRTLLLPAGSALALPGAAFAEDAATDVVVVLSQDLEAELAGALRRAAASPNTAFQVA